METDIGRIARSLETEMASIPVIDAHDHLPEESAITSQPADVLTRIFWHYSVTSAVSAGMTGDRLELKNTAIPLEERWRKFRPCLDSIRDTGYFRTAQRAAKELFGIEEVTDANYQELSASIQAQNTPGIYDRILREKCNIKLILNQGTWKDDRYSMMVYRGFMLNYFPGNVLPKLDMLYEESRKKYGAEFNSAVEWIDFSIEQVVKEKYIGIKLAAYLQPECLDNREAESFFRKFRDKRIQDDEAKELSVWIYHRVISKAPEYNLIVTVHCGINWNTGCPFSQLSPMNLEPVAIRYPDTVFDLYHAGIPWVREIAVLANQYPNVNLNLCWCTQISPYMTEHFLNEWLDLVPVNKIIGFGGDNASPEKTYGALLVNRECIARALAVRIARGHMTESRAIEVCRMWLYDNSIRIYNLQNLVPGE